MSLLVKEVRAVVTSSRLLTQLTLAHVFIWLTIVIEKNKISNSVVSMMTTSGCVFNVPLTCSNLNALIDIRS